MRYLFFALYSMMFLRISTTIAMMTKIEDAANAAVVESAEPDK